MPQKDDRSRYDQLIERVFFNHYAEKFAKEGPYPTREEIFRDIYCEA